jgi:hypothetical protein
MVALYRAGECVIYRKQKFSTHPGPRATNVWPTPNGDSYSYCVDKYYRVVAMRPDNQVVVVTRRGRRHSLAVNDPALRRASWWQRLLFRWRFPPFVPAEEATTNGR